MDSFIRGINRQFSILKMIDAKINISAIIVPNTSNSNLLKSISDLKKQI